MNNLEEILVKENKETLGYKIEEKVWEHDVSFLEAIVMIAEENDYELDMLVNKIPDYIKVMLEKEGRDLHLLPKSEGLF